MFLIRPIGIGLTSKQKFGALESLVYIVIRTLVYAPPRIRLCPQKRLAQRGFDRRSSLVSDVEERRGATSSLCLTRQSRGAVNDILRALFFSFLSLRHQCETTRECVTKAFWRSAKGFRIRVVISLPISARDGVSADKTEQCSLDLRWLRKKLIRVLWWYAGDSSRFPAALTREAPVESDLGLSNRDTLRFALRGPLCQVSSPGRAATSDSGNKRLLMSTGER